MSAAANSAAYWRIAGMSYLKYANACAEIVRGALKEPHLSKARARDAVYYKQTKYVKGVPEKAVITEVLPADVNSTK